jgi:hypothetical protein
MIDMSAWQDLFDDLRQRCGADADEGRERDIVLPVAGLAVGHPAEPEACACLDRP